MKKPNFTETQIMAILNEAESGVKVEQVSRTHGISSAAYYKRKSKYGGMEASGIKRLEGLEDENDRPKRTYAGLSLEHRAMRDLLEKSFNNRGEAPVGSASSRTGLDGGAGMPPANRANGWPNEEVAERWMQLYNGHLLVSRWLENPAGCDKATVERSTKSLQIGANACVASVGLCEE